MNGKKTDLPKKSIAILGDCLTGKSILSFRFFGGDFSESYLSTAANDYYARTIEITNLKEKVQLRGYVWDTVVGERYREMLNRLFSKLDGIILLFAVNNRESFDHLQNWIELIQKKKDINIFPIIIIGNKIDLKREVSYEEGENYAKKFNFEYFETSGKTEEGIKEAFHFIFAYVYFKNKILVYNRNFNEHYLDNTTAELENMISKINKEQSNNVIYQKIKEIENYLVEMKPVKCDIFYQKYFSILFQKIAQIKDINLHNMTYANVYLQLSYLFPEIQNFF